LGTSATVPEKTLASSYGKKEGKGVKHKKRRGKRKEITSPCVFKMRICAISHSVGHSENLSIC